MRIGVAATPDVAIPTLNWLLHSEHEVALVITQPDRPTGRGQLLQQTTIANWAEIHQLPVVKPESARDLVGKIEDLDLVLTIGYGVLLPENILSLPKKGFLNLHFSLLPAYRGAALCIYYSGILHFYGHSCTAKLESEVSNTFITYL